LYEERFDIRRRDVTVEQLVAAVGQNVLSAECASADDPVS
jgi:hypothetical protein